MAEPFIGEIRIMPYTFAPRSWAFCNGQAMSIAQNTALFSICGTTYGGDGQTTFNLPDLRARAPLHFGHGPGLSSYPLGAATGDEQVTLTEAQLPPHTHAVQADASEADENSPAGNTLAQGVESNRGGSTPKPLYTGAAPASALDPHTVSVSGGSGSHENRQPYLAFNFCIALMGLFPSRS
jgi:microcystin-dependent protein